MGAAGGGGGKQFYGPYREKGKVLKDPKKWEPRPYTDVADPLSWVWFIVTIVLGIGLVISLGWSVCRFITWDYSDLPQLARTWALQIVFTIGWFFATFKRV